MTLFSQGPRVLGDLAEEGLAVGPQGGGYLWSNFSAASWSISRAANTLPQCSASSPRIAPGARQTPRSCRRP
eukprot:6228662-Pyramimonas_sp.AAC.1